MIIAVKKRGFETLWIVTSGTIRSARTRCKLSLVRIFMAVSTKLVWDWISKITLFVASVAGQVRMLPNQTKLGEAMIEIFSGAIILPAAGVVAGVASVIELQIFEGAPMRIVVAFLAAAETQSFEEKTLLIVPGFSRFIPVLPFRDTCCHGGHMASLAQHLAMQARQRKFRAGVAESGGWSPGYLAVTAKAIGSKLFLVRLPVAGDAPGVKPQKGEVEVFHPDLGPGSSRNPGRSVADVAFLFPMFAFQSETGLNAMIEAYSIQMDECRFRAAMFHMTLCAIAGGAFVGA